MPNSFVAWRGQFIFALCLPVAVLLGYMLADPLDMVSMAAVVLFLICLSIPILMYAYHPLLIIAWNSVVVPYFLPGQPFLWMLLAFMSLAIATINRFTSKEAAFISVPAIIWPLLVLLAAVVGTAWFRGGLGMRVFGSSQFGGRGYFYIVASIVGYFAITSRRIEKHRAGTLVGLFFITGLTALIPNLAYLGGPKYALLYLLFPANYALEQAEFDYTPDVLVERIGGLTLASSALYCWLLARYGLRGIFDLSRPLRFVLFIIASLGCLFCGYRGFLLLFLLTLAVQFFAEKLYQPRVLITLGLTLVFVLALALPNTARLPLVVQRSIAFLPVELNLAVRASTDSSSQWRLDMWRELRLEIPKYLFAGKGYAIDPAQLDLVTNTHRGGHEWAVVTGSYHNGPLTLVIPFGIWGLGAFLWFIVSSLKYLYRSYLYGDPDYKTINTFLLAYFIASFVYYMGAFGNFSTDLFHFTGIIALSVSLNGSRLPVAEEAQESPRPSTQEEEVATASAV